MSSSNPRVSVLMPVFNGAQYIGEAVRSVLASTFPDLELLVLDGGSSDGSVEEAHRAASGDSRLRVIVVTERGVGLARNVGLSEARGEYIANLDADDAMFPTRLGIQVAYLDQHPDYVVIGSRVLVMSATGAPEQVLGRSFTHEEIDGALLEGRWAIGNPCAMFRKSAALAIGGYSPEVPSTGEDYDFWLRIGEVGKLANLPEVLTRYRIHGGNVSLIPTERDARLSILHNTLTRAFARRGITDRAPAKIKAPPVSAAEQRCDAALLRYFQGKRASALVGAFVAYAADPSRKTTRSALRTILAGPPLW